MLSPQDRGPPGVHAQGKLQMNGQSRSLWILVILMVAASFAIRVAAWAYWGTGTIESEGAEYAKIAANLRSGVGYVGLVSPGPQVLFNPLFSFLIAGASFIVQDYELAGRLVALVIGALLPLPVFGLASRLFNRRVGYIAAALALLHPLLVYLSFMVYSEGPYATLLLSAIYLVVLAIDQRSTRLWLLVGAAFGLCYLLRAEAVAALAISVLFAVVATEGVLAIRLKRAAYAAAVFLVLALPQIVFIYTSTGKLLLEAKTTILFSYAGRRILAAETNPGVLYVSDGGQRDMPSRAPNTDGGYPDRWEEKWATFGMDDDLKGTGFAMRPWVDMARETHIRLDDLLPLVVKGLRRNIPRLFQNLSSGWLGAPVLPALALLGAFRRPWRGPRALTRLFLISVTAAPVLATFLVLWGDARYHFIFVPLLCVWAANGLFEIGSWAKASIAATGWHRIAAVSRWMLPGFLWLVMIVTTVKQVSALYEFSDSALPTRVDKEVGLWIERQQQRPIRIMDLSLPLSYHANVENHVFFPYCTGELALRFLDAAQVDYVVLRRGLKFTVYYEEWLTQGIPDRRAELLQLPSEAAADKFVIYRWHRNH